jgi:hypothetical protein
MRISVLATPTVVLAPRFRDVGIGMVVGMNDSVGIGAV